MLVFYAWKVTYGSRECATGSPEGRKDIRRPEKSGE